jgi:hypothetical protein
MQSGRFWQVPFLDIGWWWTWLRFWRESFQVIELWAQWPHDLESHNQNHLHPFYLLSYTLFTTSNHINIKLPVVIFKQWTCLMWSDLGVNYVFVHQPRSFR